MLVRRCNMTGPCTHFQMDFTSSIESHGLPFTFLLTCDTSEAGRSLFNEFAPSTTVFSSGNDLLNHICASGQQSIISYLINSYCF